MEGLTNISQKQIDRLIRIKVKLANDFFDINVMADNIDKIERCDRLIKKLITQSISACNFEIIKSSPYIIQLLLI